MMPRAPIIVAACLLTALSAGLAALEDDRDQPIRIRAQRVEANEKTGLTVYEGKVEAVQGSLRITADRIVLRRRDGRTEHMQAVGRPLTLKQKPDPAAPEIHARAKRLEYDVTRGEVELFGQVVVRQAQDTLKSAYLFLRLDDDTLRARGGKNDDERVQAIYHPKPRPEAAP